MGGTSRYNASDWATKSAVYRTQSTQQTFSTHGLHKDLDPKNIKVRESRDSLINPNSNAIIIALDETGSMGFIPKYMIDTGLGTVFEALYEKIPVSDPHVMTMGIGDAYTDMAPLQVAQFECDVDSLTGQLEKIYLEGNGGGNNQESYTLAWYFAANKTSIDCFEKRGKKGYLFTIGDEPISNPLTRDQLERITGDNIESDSISTEELYAQVSRMYHVYHIIVKEGSYCRSNQGFQRVVDSWRNVLGENAIVLEDHTKLAEAIVSAIQLNEGTQFDDVLKGWSGETALVIKASMSGLAGKNMTAQDSGSAVVRF